MEKILISIENLVSMVQKTFNVSREEAIETINNEFNK